MKYAFRVTLLLSLINFIFSAPFCVFPQGHSYPQGTNSTLFIPDNYKVRQEYRELIYFSLYKAREAKERIWSKEGLSTRVKFKIVEQDDTLIFLFLNEKNGDFPMTGSGNASIMRNLTTSEIIKMTILLRDSNTSYLRLMPDKDRTSVDIFLSGTRLYHNLIVPMPFNELLFEPLATIIQTTKNIVDWESILYKGPPEDSIKGLGIFNEIRKYLPSMHTAADGAMDGEGKYVFIEDLKPQPTPGGFNCSGFAKWIVDGFYFGFTGKYTEIDVLKEKQLEQRGNRWSSKYEDKSDPYFGLDWTRNLAKILYQAQSGETDIDCERFDVRHIPYLEYIEDVGYPVNDLNLILFFLAKENPDRFYLGSVNTEGGTSIKLRRHYHIAVFFPYFSSSDTLEIIVMEKNKETNLSSFLKDYKGNHIHLVALPINGTFRPPKL
jgi:hypothetical protein